MDLWKRASAVEMKHRYWLGIVAFAVTSALAADQGARTPEEALKFFALADDLTIELVAAEPLIASPCAMAFDERGRLFVAENRGYPRTSEPPQGSIALLEDTDGDGRMDKRTVFADGLAYPNGVLPWQGGLIVTCAPDVLFLRDTDGDGRADERRVLLTGFATAGSTQLRVNAPLLGPDGWIWLASGLSGGTITNPAHPEFGSLELKSDLRFDPHTGRFEAVDGRSQYGHSFDELGRRFICMNRIQVQHVVLSAQHLRRNPHLAFSETVQNCPDLVPNPLLRGGSGAARIFPISENITTADSHAGTFSAACAVTIWDGPGALPADPYRHVALSCDPTGNLIHADKLERRGGTFAAVSLFKDREFLASRDNWFRPVFLGTGPDGALYVCDMYRKVIEHPDYLPAEIAKHTDFEAGKEMGRIWRIRAKDAERKITPTIPADTQALGALLTDGNPWVRATARRLLLEKHTPDKPVSLEPANPEQARDPRWLLSRRLFAPLADAALEAALTEPAPDGVNAVVTILRDDRAANRRDASLLLRLGSPSAALWSFDLLPFVVALGTVQDDAAVPLLIKAGQRCSSEDRWTAAALVASAAGRELPVLRGLLQDLPENRSQMTARGSLVSLLTETLGRADATASTNSLETILTVLRGQDYLTRAAVAAAYAKGRQITLDPAGGEIRALLDETRQILDSPERTPAETIPVLACAPWEWGGKPLLALAASGNREALQALARWDQPEIPKALLGSPHFSKGTMQLQEETLAVCFGRPSFFPAILEALESGALSPVAVTPQRRQLLLKSKDAEVRERAAKLFALPEGDRKEAFEKAKASLALTGKSANGREIFNRACAICHRLDREGVAVGPDLFDIRNQPKESILLHIVVPEAEIAPGFAAYLAETEDGRSLAGVLVSETPESITVRQPGGAEESILRAKLKSVSPLPTSLMPAGLEAAMSLQELADLLAYLRGEG